MPFPYRLRQTLVIGIRLDKRQLMIRSTLLSLLFFFTSSLVFAQADSLVTKIRVQGQAYEATGMTLANLLIINERTYTGTFGDASGRFDISALKTDTLVFGAIGYNSYKICFADSAIKETYTLRITLRKLSVELGEAEVIAPRDMEDIQRDIEQLGYNPKDHRTTGANALESPITFLYEMLSRREQSKRLVIEMENDDRRRDLLKELFSKYIAYDIIELKPEEFDEFVEFLNVSDDFLKSSSQYDFIQFVRARFNHFKVMKRTRRLDDTDYNYHED